MLTDLTILGEAITRLRGERSQRFAARRAKVPVGTWSQWEHGHRQPRQNQLGKIVLGIDCSLEELEVEVWKVWSERLRDRQLEPVATTDKEVRRRVEEIWKLDFTNLPPGIERAMARMRRRIDGMWESWREHFEPLVGDFEALSRFLDSELGKAAHDSELLTRKDAEHRDDDPSS